MWVICRSGFYSVVAYDPKRWPKEAAEVGAKEFGDHVLVRGRVAEDIAILCETVGTEFREDPTADYRYRTIVPKELWAQFVAQEAEDIDYTNFKNTVKDRNRHNVYMAVWGVLHRLQPSRWLSEPLRASESVSEEFSAGESRPSGCTCGSPYHRKGNRLCALVGQGSLLDGFDTRPGGNAYPNDFDPISGRPIEKA